MTVLFLYLIFVFVHSLCVLDTFFLPSHPYDFKAVISVMNVHKLSAFNMFLLVAAQSVLTFKFMLLYSSLSFFWYSLTAVCVSIFIITRNQYQCDKIQNCINCLALKITFSQPSICSLKCWKQPRDIPNNMQIMDALKIPIYFITHQAFNSGVKWRN